MKKRRNFWALTAAVVLALGACSDEEATTTPPVPPGGTDLPPVAVEGGLTEVAVGAEGAWRAVSDAHWCVPAAPEGSGSPSRCWWNSSFNDSCRDNFSVVPARICVKCSVLIKS